jgi:hypothetical protein
MLETELWKLTVEACRLKRSPEEPIDQKSQIPITLMRSRICI